MDRLESMKIFVRVAELASFTQAAETLSLPKATVSTCVQQLESALGTQLLHRTTRKVSLTLDGTIFFERCLDLLADIEETESLFRRNNAQVSGRIRVDMAVGMARSLIIPRLPEFLAKHPALKVELSCTDRQVDVIREGFDCVVRVGKLADSGLMARPLGRLAMMNCASPAYIEKHGMPSTLDDLKQHILVHYQPVLGLRPDGFEYFDGDQYRTLTMDGSVTVNNTDAYTAGCLAGLGIIQVPQVGMRHFLKEGRLVRVLPGLECEPMPISLIYPHRRNLARRVQLFMDWMAGLVKSYAEEA